jgi:hypothetical protein
MRLIMAALGYTLDWMLRVLERRLVHRAGKE